MTVPSEAVPPVPAEPPRYASRPGLIDAITVALVLTGMCMAAQVVAWAAPEPISRSAFLKHFLLPEPMPFRVTRILLPIGWGVAALLGLMLLARPNGAPKAQHATGPLKAGRAPGVRSEQTVQACRLGVLGALLSPFAIMPLSVMGSNLPQLLLCLIPTLAALLLVHRVQLYRRMPGWLLVSGFGWGALIGGGFGLVMITWMQRSIPGYFMSGSWERPLDGVRELYTLFPLHTAVVTELGKAAGVAVLVLLFRRHIDGVVSGVSLGAAVALGYNLTETVHYLDLVDSAHHFTQLWDRQVVGLLTTHVAFTALAGAGIGAARWLPARRDRVLTIGGGLVAAVGGHFETDVVLMHLDGHRADWFADETLGLLIGIPAMTGIASGVFVALYVLILYRGLRAQAAGLTRALRDEAASGLGAVTEPEIGLLLSPRRRLLLELQVWRRDGTAGLRHLLRFQQAQLDLAVQRWHRERPGADSFIPQEKNLRGRVLELKGMPTSSESPSMPDPEALS
jgi:RsiW-degrading membrane proteinase PrsW (M82 family)